MAMTMARLELNSCTVFRQQCANISAHRETEAMICGVETRQVCSAVQVRVKPGQKYSNL